MGRDAAGAALTGRSSFRRRRCPAASGRSVGWELGVGWARLLRRCRRTALHETPCWCASLGQLLGWGIALVIPLPEHGEPPSMKRAPLGGLPLSSQNRLWAKDPAPASPPKPPSPPLSPLLPSRPLLLPPPSSPAPPSPARSPWHPRSRSSTTRVSCARACASGGSGPHGCDGAPCRALTDLLPPPLCPCSLHPHAPDGAGASGAGAAVGEG